MAKEQEQQPEAAKQTLLQQALAKRAEWASEQPALGAEIRAMGREAAKDIRGTLHETFFGKPEHMSEPGTPLCPTPQMVTNDLGTLGNYSQMLDMYAARGADGPSQEKGQER
jgi:hypothetical protein